MKKNIFTICIVIATLHCYAQAYSYLGTFNSQGVPNYLVAQNDTMHADLMENIAASLPENYPVPIYNPNYISNDAATNIYMQGNGHVWVTFVDEGAGYKNVLGYYSYPAITPPLAIPTNNNLKIIFPNVSKINSGGGLVAGNKVYLGYFTAGTTISWFLLANGFNNGAVNNGLWRLFSNTNFNPEANASLRNHNVLLYDEKYKKVILGFEDIRRDNSSCDNDFNDAIFYVTATPDSAISKIGITPTTDPTPEVTTGNEGGLESNGNLALAISNRYFARQQETKNNKQNYQIELSNVAFKTNDLNKFIPILDTFGLKAYLSTPTDLIKVTNATDVLSVDYYDVLGKRQGVILATETSNKIYNHTKSICDRLKNATLENIESKEIFGYEFLTYTLTQASGEKEFVTCFSISDNGANYLLHNQWLVSQYPSLDKYYNFQIWSNLPHVNQKLVESIIEKAIQIQPLDFDMSSKKTPTTYFKKGVVNQNKITFEINNSTSFTEANLIFNYTQSEQEAREEMTFPIAINAKGTSSVTVPFDGLFDANILLSINNTTIDEMYLADGVWGAEYPETTTKLKSFTITKTSFDNNPNDDYTVQRAATVKADFSEYITLYKMLKPSNLSVDLNEYEYVNLDIKGNDQVTIRLNKKSVDEWNKQAKCKITLNGENQKISIPLRAFKNENGEALNANDLTSVSFTIASDNNKTKSSDIEINKLSFSKKATNTIYEPTNSLMVYPNPLVANQNFTVAYNASKTAQSNIIIYTLNGSKVFTKNIESTIGFNQIPLPLNTKIQTGVYILEINQQDKSERINITIK